VWLIGVTQSFSKDKVVQLPNILCEGSVRLWNREC